MKLREIRSKNIVDSWMKINDGSRTLFESTLAPEVLAALQAWKKANIQNAVLVGGLAVSFYGLARYTMDVDFLFASSSDVPIFIEGFKKLRDHAFMHKATNVEVEVLDPHYLGWSEELGKAILNSAITIDGIKVVSRAGLIATKLTRFSRQDQADIEHLLKAGSVDMSKFPLTEKQKQNFESIRNDVESMLK